MKTFNTENEFTRRMQAAMQKNHKGLFITASPDDYEETDGFSFGIKYTAGISGMSMFYRNLFRVREVRIIS